MFSVAFIVYVAFNLLLYKLYEYLKHIKLIETRPFLQALFSKGSTIRRCFLYTSISATFPLEKGIIRFAVIFIYQLYKGELNKRVLLFSSCFIVFSCFMQDFYSTLLSLMSLDIFVCYFAARPPENSREPVARAPEIPREQVPFADRVYDVRPPAREQVPFADRVYDVRPPARQPLAVVDQTIYPLELKQIVGDGDPILAQEATERVKDLPYDRKIKVMRQIRQKLILNPAWGVNKLALLNYEQLGILKNLCSDPALRNRAPWAYYAGSIVSVDQFNSNNMRLIANTKAQTNFIKNFDERASQYRNATVKPF